MDDLLQYELDNLKARADELGIKYRSNATAETLKDLIKKAMTDTPKDKAPKAQQDEVADAVAAKQAEAKRAQNEAGRLVRIKVTCLNPAKKEWDAELFSVGNAYGNHKKLVPFNVEDGWHVPYIIYEYIKGRKCQVFYDAKDGKGNTVRRGKLINEFAVEVLPDLTPDELKALAASQQARNAID